MNNKYLSYTLDLLSFMVEELELDNIRNIILFGSVARGQATKESDIDIFIDIIKKDVKYEQKIKQIIGDFYKSKFFHSYWKIKGIENDFNVIVGKLDEWKEIKDSIISNGITLYSKFKTLPEKYVYFVLIYFENVKPESKRVLLYKNLYGYNIKNKHYHGLLERYNGKKLNKGTIAVPLEHKNIFFGLFKRFKVSIKTMNVIEY
ncbi:nucleotidyltransferase domain-containing protein [Candidatus Woesearchaeota archaeon]|nr:nucleotidyltransferase domain-containing protein [Candidatus Woesearchaeota archaeon]